MKNIICLLALLVLPLHAAHRMTVFSGDNFAFPGNPSCYFSNSRMVPDRESVLLNYTCFGAADIYSEIWRITGDEGELLFASTPGNLLLDPVSIAGRIYTVEYNEVESLKLWSEDGAQSFPSAWGMVRVRDLHGSQDKVVRFRYQDANGAFHEARLNDRAWEVSPDRGIAFFFSAGVVRDTVIQKVRMGDTFQYGETQPDRIELRMAPDYTPVTVLRDRDDDPTSPYLWFSNLLSAQVGGRWALEARRAEGKVAIVGQGTSFKEIPLTPFFSVIDAWQLALTRNGDLIIRGTDQQGQKGLWTYRDDRFQLLVKSGDAVVTRAGQTAIVGTPLFYNAPLVVGEDLYIGVGLMDDSGAKFIGQGILQLNP